jgi:TM2 domain-containing membrane protein YozV
VLCLLLGGFSVHNFYLGRIGSGIAFLFVYWLGLALSLVGIGVPLLIAAFAWWVVDLCCLRDYVVSANTRPIS